MGWRLCAISASLPELQLEGAFTHLARADAPALETTAGRSSVLPA
jgi:hypothetical protein